MKKLTVVLVALLLPVVAVAATNQYRTQSGDTWESVAAKYGITVQQLADLNQPTRGTRLNVPGAVAPTPPPPPPTPTPSPVPPPPPTSGEKQFIAYTTGYGFPDNTPPSTDISNGVIHATAGGTGTFSDPITVAVGHSISGGKDTLDYPQGTKFYVPNLRRYFIVEDTCGDGSTPQNGPCHTGYKGHVWIDLWVGGSLAQKSATLACEDAITDLHLVIENPAPNYSVIPVPVFFGSCTAQFGDTIVTQ